MRKVRYTCSDKSETELTADRRGCLRVLSLSLVRSLARAVFRYDDCA